MSKQPANSFGQSISAIAWREWRRIRADRTTFLILVVIPIALILILTGIYARGVLLDMPVAVWDEDRSEVSRQMIRAVDANRSFQVTETVTSVDEIENLFQSGKIQAAFHFPADLSRKLKTNQTATVTVYKNNANLIVGNTVLKDASTIIRTFSTGKNLKSFQAKGMMPQQAMAAAAPIRVVDHSLFNPNYNYEQYLVLLMLIFTFQMGLMMIAAQRINREIASDTLKDALALARNSWSRLYLGKALPIILVHSMIISITLFIVMPLFNVTLTGNYFRFFVLYLMFSAASILMGFVLSTWIKDCQFAAEVSIIINTPAFLFSGYTFPLDAMLAPHFWYAKILPHTHFTFGYFKLCVMQIPWSAATPELLMLTIANAICLLLLGWGVARWRKGVVA